MSAIECSKPQRMNTGMQNRTPSGDLHFLNTATAIYISTPQSKPLKKVCGAV